MQEIIKSIIKIVFGDRTINSRVMQVIKGKIADAQKLYDGKVEALEKKCEADIEILEQKLETDKEAAVEEAVQSIIGKIL